MNQKPGIVRRALNALAPGSAVQKANPVVAHDYRPYLNRSSWGLSGAPASYANYASTSDLVYALTRVRAVNFAQPRIVLFQKSGKEGKERTERPDHPKQLALQFPSRYWTSKRLRRMQALDLGLMGVSFTFIENQSGRKFPELWRLRPDRVKVVPDAEDYIAGFIYVAEDGSKIPILPEEMLWLRYEHPTSEYDGLAPLASARLHADLRHKSLKGNVNLLDEDNVLRGVIITDQDVGDEEANEIIARFEASLSSGGPGARNTALLSSGAKYQVVQIPPKDMMWLESSGYSDYRLCGAFQVPPPMVGIMEHATLANVEAYEQIFWREWGTPEIDWYIEELNTQFLTPEEQAQGFYFEADMSPVDALREDEDKRSQRDVREILAGIRTVNEVRRDRGEDDVEWGDTWWLPGNLLPFDQQLLEDAANPPEPPPALPPGQPDGQPVDANGDQQPATDGTNAGKLLAEKREANGMVAHERRLLRDQRRTKRAIGAFWQRQESEMLAKLEEVAPRDELPFGLTADDLYSPADKQAQLAATFRPLLLNAATVSGEALETDFALDVPKAFSPLDPLFLFGVESRAAFYAQTMARTGDAILSALVTTAVEEGWGVGKLSRALQLEMRNWRAVRADAAAWTSMTWAHNFGKLEGMKQVGVQWKTWASAGDSRVRPAHQDADFRYHTSPIQIGEAFQVGGESIMHPGEGSPANSIRCRCAVIPATRSQVIAAEKPVGEGVAA